MRSPLRSWRLWVSMPFLAVLGAAAMQVSFVLWLLSIGFAFWWGWKIHEWDEMDEIERREREKKSE